MASDRLGIPLAGPQGIVRMALGAGMDFPLGPVGHKGGPIGRIMFLYNVQLEG